MRHGSCLRRLLGRVGSYAYATWLGSPLAQNLVSHHLRLLHAHRLVTSRRSGELVMYSLTDEERSLLGAVLGGGRR
jgi:DNA-binding transcriptional ArsR family regulator